MIPIPVQQRVFQCCKVLLHLRQFLRILCGLLLTVFLDSDEQLSHTESLYSSNGRMNEMYNFSSDFLLTLNLRALKRLTLVQAFRDVLLTCSFHVQVLENVRPKCL